jgi:hypothetical protein
MRDDVMAKIEVITLAATAVEAPEDDSYAQLLVSLVAAFLLFF